MGRSVRIPITTLLILMAAAGCTTAPPQTKALADEYFNLGNAWFELKKYDLAAGAYRKALDWNPQLKVASVNLARTKAETGDPAGALALLGPLADADPENLVLAQHRAWLVAKKDGPAAAAELYSTLADRLPGDPATLFNAGFCLKAAGRNEEALRRFQAWRAADGKTAPGLTALAEVLGLLKSPEAAQAWLEVALTYPENDGRRFPPLAARARALAEAGAFGDAVQTWDTALALPASGTAAAARAEAQFQRGSVLLLKLQDFEAGSRSVLDAWKGGYKDTAAWKALRSSPELTFGPQLEAALSAAGVSL